MGDERLASNLAIGELSAFGATPESIVEIGKSVDYRHLDYLDLPVLPTDLPRVTAVVEMAGRPVLYVVRGPIPQSELDPICHLLSQRGAADHLGILEPGVLRVVPLLTVGKAKRAPPSVWQANDSLAPSRLPGLAFGINRGNAPGTAHRLQSELVSLLTDASKAIKEAGVDSPEDALSLVGRALFLRFLIDRRIISDGQVDRVCPGAGSLVEALESPKRVDATSQWLDSTFNGNLLPLSKGRNFWRGVDDPQAVCDELSKILLKAGPNGQLRFEWATLDFSHIPVGLLSQVYEQWCHTFSREKAIRDSVWYTPRTIAEYLVDEVFFDLEKPHSARILDPAVGAGVFLVAAFRELVAARWRKDGTRPTRKTIRQILYNQLVGFDVNEASLRLTALALYLTALELDPNPHPTESLRFEDLRACGVVCDVRGEMDQHLVGDELPMVGSLGEHIPDSHVGKYDVVLGNPPWTAWTASKSSDKRVAERRRVVETAISPFVHKRTEGAIKHFEMVDNAPDLPFCWRALEWAKPGGTVAFALHSRLLFRQSKKGTEARNHLFGATAITGILNGAALAQTNVWPTHEAPFCLLFATNRRPEAGDGFHFVSPVLDKSLNTYGYLRVDASSAHPVFQSQIPKQPWLLKTLYRGTPLDVDIMAKLMVPEHPTLGKYLGEHKLSRSRGYVEGGSRSPKRDFPHLYSLLDLQNHHSQSVLIDLKKLKKFQKRKVNTGRKAAIFKGPLVLLFEAPRHTKGTPRALLAKSDVAFNHVFYGISTANHPEKHLLSRYLLVVLNSRLVLYVALMRSLQFGADRKRMDLDDLLSVPIPRLESLPGGIRDEIKRLSDKLISAESLPEDEIDEFVGSLFGLSSWDLEVVRDTLSVSLPFKRVIDSAQEVPASAVVTAFADRISDILGPVLRHAGRRVEVDVLPHESASPWIVLSLKTWPNEQIPLEVSESPKEFIEQVMTVASDGGASRVVLKMREPGHLLIGLFAQYRYWTQTQARMLTLDLLGDRELESWLRGQKQ